MVSAFLYGPSISGKFVYQVIGNSTFITGFHRTVFEDFDEDGLYAGWQLSTPGKTVAAS
jgi:hypothetical protein